MNAQTIRQEATHILQRDGVSMQYAHALLDNEIVKADKLPIDDYLPNAETIAAHEDHLAGRGLTRCKTVDEMLKSIID